MASFLIRQSLNPINPNGWDPAGWLGCLEAHGCRDHHHAATAWLWGGEAVLVRVVDRFHVYMSKTTGRHFSVEEIVA